MLIAISKMQHLALTTKQKSRLLANAKH